MPPQADRAAWPAGSKCNFHVPRSHRSAPAESHRTKLSACIIDASRRAGTDNRCPGSVPPAACSWASKARRGALSFFAMVFTLPAFNVLLEWEHRTSCPIRGRGRHGAIPPPVPNPLVRTSRSVFRSNAPLLSSEAFRTLGRSSRQPISSQDRDHRRGRSGRRWSQPCRSPAR